MSFLTLVKRNRFQLNTPYPALGILSCVSLPCLTTHFASRRFSIEHRKNKIKLSLTFRIPMESKENEN